MRSPRILLLTLEYPKWCDAGKFSYESNFGIEEGLAANGIVHVTAPVMFCDGPSAWQHWQECVQRRIGDDHFDQVWFDVVHPRFSDAFLEWIHGRAPVRLGFFGESSAFDPVEVASNPQVAQARQDNSLRNLEHATHVVAVDEADVDQLNREGKRPAFWWAAGRIPSRFIAKHPTFTEGAGAQFFGTLYGRRKAWVEHPAMRGRLTLGASLEAGSPWPAAYDEMTGAVESALGAGNRIEGPMWDQFVDGIRQARRACYPLWMRSLGQASAIVNLPQYARAYASRVTQAMAAGVPVISWEIPGRPKTKALFEDGKEMLLFQPDSPESLAEAIDRLRGNPALARSLAENALKKMRAHHSMESYVRDLLGWIEEHRPSEGGKGTRGSGAARADCAVKAEGATLDAIRRRGLWREGQPLRLHLGCGEQRFEGYLNVDYPSSEHSVMKVRPDFEADIQKMEFPEATVDEIRLHHVFEHFDRVTALAMLVRWSRWLKPGGLLTLETPDIEGCAKVLLSPVSWRTKMGIIRHLTGDQADEWAYHVDHWFPERFKKTLETLGFVVEEARSQHWAVEPFLANVTVRSKKSVTHAVPRLLELAEGLLEESLVSTSEQATFAVWKRQLRSHFPAEAISQASGAREIVLGLKMVGHDASIFALFPDERDVFAMAEERLTRFKHDDLFPLDAIHRMLEYKGIDPRSVGRVRAAGSFICHGEERWPARHYELTKAWRRFFGASYAKEFSAASQDFFALSQEEQVRRLQGSEAGLEVVRWIQESHDEKETLDQQYRRHLSGIFPNARIDLTYHDHELCHAMSAYVSSKFEDALVVAFDGWGDGSCFSKIYEARRGVLKELSRCVSSTRLLRLSEGQDPVEHECSIGGIYSCFTQRLGFAPNADEGKTEALAAYGNWDNAVYRELMGLVRVSVERGIEIDHARATEALQWSRLEKLVAEQGREDMAAAVQKFTEDIVLAYLRPWVERTGLRRICLSGGVVANVILNLKIYEQLAEEVFIVPAMADDGAAQGAALLEWLSTGALPSSLDWFRNMEMPYWGTSYEPAEVVARVRAFLGGRAESFAVADAGEAWPEEAAARVCRGEVGAIFHGRMEWGPRALGNRSIIADARNPKIRDIINRDIKNRPWFQPFCPSMLAEERERLFDRAYPNKHMTIAFELKPEFRAALPGAIHIDGTSRVQFVFPSDNPAYHRLLTKVKDLTGFGVLVNTSFNRHGRTIVESPEDALRDFIDSNMDFVVIEGVVVSKIVAPPALQAAPQRIGVVAFSKDRPLQLDGALRSLRWHSRDLPPLRPKVIFTSDSEAIERQYASLATEHPGVDFIREGDFKNDLLNALRDVDLVLFMVDDCIFVKDFSLETIAGALGADQEAIGCSLRLGENTTFCYPLNRSQVAPEFKREPWGGMSFSWTGAEYDFGYPLEVSSSVYRVSDLLPWIESEAILNPNVLEAKLAESAIHIGAKRPRLLCYPTSRAFCAPWNRVQSTYLNRAADSEQSSSEELSARFAEGWRLDLDRYVGHTPGGCHEEAQLRLIRLQGEPSVTVVIPCFNQSSFIEEALQSVVAQSFQDWEVVVVDDGSTDDSAQKAGWFARRHPGRRIRILTRENGGLSEARNTGFRAARAALILPLDADDRLDPKMLERTVLALAGDPGAGVAFTDVSQFGARNDVWITGQGEPRDVLANNRHAYCALIRKSVWEKVGGYRANMTWGYEDWDFWVGCLEYGVREIKVPGPLFFYRTKTESMLTRALAHDAELRSQIVLNHPSLFDEPTRSEAANLLASAKASGATPCVVDPADTLMDAAAIKLSQHDASGAAGLLRQAQEIARDRQDIPELLGGVLFGMGDHLGALEAFSKAVEGSPSATADLLLKWAVAAEKCGSYDIFERAIQRCLEVDPSHLQANLFLAGLNLRVARWSDAARSYHTVLKSDANHIEALLGIALALAESGEYDTAREAYERVLAIQPFHVLARENLEALDRRLASASLSPSDNGKVDEALGLADAAYGAGRFHEAEEQLAIAAAEKANDATIWSSLGSLRFTMGRFFEAQVAFAHVTGLRPDDAGAWARLAQAAIQSRDILVFDASMTRALELEPEHSEALRLLAKVNAEQGRYADAAKISIALVRKHPSDVDLLLLAGFCFGKSSEWEAASACFERVLAFDPGHALAAENLSSVQRQGASASLANGEQPIDHTPSPASSTLGPSPEISVVVPTFNRPEILSRCLEGFCRQTVAKERFEVVIVDDGSSPAVKPVADRYMGRLNIVYRWQSNAGLAAARNAAIEAAHAPWLALHDDDDVPEPDYLARCLEFHARHPEENEVLLAQVVPDPSLPCTPLLEWMFDSVNGVIGFPESNGVYGYARFYGGTSSCKKALFRHGAYDPEFRFGFEDMEFAHRLSRSVSLRVHYHEEARSRLIRASTFDDLFRRSYREGRSMRRFFAKAGPSAFDLVPPCMNRSCDTLALMRPRIAEIVALIRRMESLGGLERFSINLDGRELRGAEALKGCYSLAVRCARAEGWVDQAQGVAEHAGLDRMQGILDGLGVPEDLVAPSEAGKRALVYFHCNPFPARSGAHRRCLSVLRGLRQLGYAITLASSDYFSDQPWCDDALIGLAKDLGIKVRVCPRNAEDEAEIREAQQRGDFWSMHAPSGLKRWFLQLFSEERPEVVLVNYAYHSDLVADAAFDTATRLVEMHDLVSLGGSMARAASSAIGQSPYTVGQLSGDATAEDFFALLHLVPEEEEFRRYRTFDGVIAISEQERVILQQRVPGLPVTWLPVTSQVPDMENRYDEGPVCVVFANSFNIQGLLYFVDKVLPEVSAHIPGFRLRVAGDACRLLTPHPGLELLGFVPDLKALYETAAFAICPLLGGTGQQVKISEAMAHGLPVVVHQNVAASSPVIDGVNGFVAANAKAFARRVVELHRNRSLCRKLGEAARVVMQEQFGVDAFNARLANAIAAAQSPTTSDGPRESMGRLPVRWSAPFFNPSGYASEAIEFVRSLAGQVHLAIRHHNKIFSEEFVRSLPPERLDLLNHLESRWESAANGISVYHMPAPGFARLEGAVYHIGRTMFETDRLPKSWISPCNRMDEIWVPSEFHRETFAAAGVERDKLVVIPACVDLALFDPEKTDPLPLPNRAAFNFLAVFEWTSRKGWDVLLSAYLQEFCASDDVCLFLKCSLPDEPDAGAGEAIRSRIRDHAATLNLGAKALPRIEVLGCQLPAGDLPRLYKAVDCLVAPSRGEGWGRPQHEAMAMGLPVVGTGWSGTTAFLNEQTGFPIEFDLVEARGLEPELWHYHGHRWAEPRESHLRSLMRTVLSDPKLRAGRAEAGRRWVRDRFSPEVVSMLITERFMEIEQKLSRPSMPPVQSSPPDTRLKELPSSAAPHRPLRVAWEGSFLDFGSLSHVNRELTAAMSSRSEVQLTRIGKNVLPPEHAHVLALQRAASLLRAQPPKPADIVVRHAWPPSFDRPGTGAWIWFQPWEYGTLPRDWVAQANQVDEIWAYSNYVRRVYIDSGVDPAKVGVVPLGIDPALFHPGVPGMALQTRKRFKFLFVGGTIHRKGPDLLLSAYLSSFTAQDDVCLVIKDFGGRGLYAGQTLHQAIAEARRRPNSPEILHLDEELLPEAIPSLYAACDVLVHPYRGEGFGLPVLEAMACGLPVVVTAGGSTDDFATDALAYRIPSRRVPIGDRVGEVALAHAGWLLEPDLESLRALMKAMPAKRDEAHEKGKRAAAHVREHWTWEKAAAVAASRITQLRRRLDEEKSALEARRSRKTPSIELPDVARLGQLKEARRLVNEGRLDEAWNETARAITLRPFHPVAYRLLADIARQSGDVETARQALAEVRTMAPGWKHGTRISEPPSRPDTAKGLRFDLPKRTHAPRLTVCLITRNEEKFLSRCLESVRKIADQIVVVDTGSSDRTVEIALAHRAEVHKFGWNDDFSAARNEALAAARGDWVLALDADEELDPESAAKIREAMLDPKAMAWRLPMVDVGREAEGRSFVPRLFRNAPGLFYLGRVHEQVFSSIEVIRKEWGLENRLGDAKLIHHGYARELVKDRRKSARNVRLLEKAVQEMPNEPALLMNLGLELHRAGQTEAALEYYTEAWHSLAGLPRDAVVPELRETLLTQYANLLLGTGDFAGVVRILEHPVARQAPLSASLHFTWGLACLRLQQFQDAAEQMSACLKKRGTPALSPINTEILTVAPRHCLAASLAMLRRTAEAEQAFAEALMEQPSSVPLLWDFARFEADRGRPLDAIKALHKLVGEEPNHLEAWQLGARLASSRPDFAEFGVDWCGEALKRHPSDRLLRRSLAEVLTTVGNFEEAATAWDAAQAGEEPDITAARLLCSSEAIRSMSVMDDATEKTVSLEYVKWYRKIVAAGAEAAVKLLNSRMDQLAGILPTAASHLARMLDNAGVHESSKQG